MFRVILALGAGAVVVAGATTARGAASLEPAPVLRATSLSPLNLLGAYFDAGERVLVTLSAGQVTRRRRVQARADGTFTVEFGLVAFDPCPGRWLVAVAAGAKGSKATFKRACRPAHKQPEPR